MTRLVLLTVVGSCLYAQESPKFEVASIKVRPVTEISFTSGGAPSGSHLRLEAMSLVDLIWWAYQTDYWRIAGGPSWKATRHFDIDARAEGERARPIEEFRAMLRDLLAERFHLVVRRENRETYVYALTIDKGGVKMRESSPAAKSYVTISSAKLVGSATTAAALVNFLSNRTGVDRPVIDCTGLTGKYDFALESSVLHPNDTADAAPDIFAALREQLGLRLVPQNARIEYLVIDHAEMPTGN